MAKQEFRLEQVLKFRKEVEKMHQLELAAAKMQHDQAQERLTSENSKLDALAQEFSQRQLKGIDASEVQLYGAFKLRKSQEIRTMKDSLTGLEQLVQEKREALTVAAKEKKALEVFKEKKMAALRMERLLRERDFLDEIAVQRGGQK